MPKTSITRVDSGSCSSSCCHCFSTTPETPSPHVNLTGQMWLEELFRSPVCMHEQLSMSKHVFRKLSMELRVLHGLSDGKYVTADEQLAIFLHFACTGASSHMLQERFQRSGETISKYTLLFKVYAESFKIDTSKISRRCWLDLSIENMSSHYHLTRFHLLFLIIPKSTHILSFAVVQLMVPSSTVGLARRQLFVAEIERDLFHRTSLRFMTGCCGFCTFLLDGMAVQQTQGCSNMHVDGICISLEDITFWQMLDSLFVTCSWHLTEEWDTIWKNGAVEIKSASAVMLSIQFWHLFSDHKIRKNFSIFAMHLHEMLLNVFLV
jgi:hypothetical protein